MNIKKFLKSTEALAVCGYKTDIDWLDSTVFDILLINAFQDNEFSLRGIMAIEQKIKKIKSRFRELKFQIVSQKQIKKNRIIILFSLTKMYLLFD